VRRSCHAEKTENYVLTVATREARNANEPMVADLTESEFGGNLASVAVKMFPHSIYFKKFYKICAFNAICKDNAAINYITVQHKKGSLPSTLTGHTTLVRYHNNNFIRLIYHAQ
jgi:hypothetical protein